ncbi:MAG: WD40 repeat domain-containing protein [Saprospirales bacterium]|nr:WD40 repeat domain-containing protein [Saprospirales bacterium]
MKNSLLLLALLLTSSFSNPPSGKSYELYLTQIAAAEAYLQLNLISAAKSYLDACPEKYRGVEWHFLNAFLDQSDKTLPAPEGQVYNCIQVSPDGSKVAVGGSDSTVTIFSFPDWKMSGKWRGHKASVSTLDFSEDGKKLVSGGRDHAVIVWDVETGQKLWENSQAFSQGIYQVRFGAGDRQIGVVSWERRSAEPWVMGFAKVLDAASGEELQKIETEAHPAAGVVFTDGGKSLVVSCWGEVATSYELGSGSVQWKYDLSNYEEYNAFHSIDLSPDGRTILLGAADFRVHVLESASGKLLRRIEPWEGHTKLIKAVAWSRDGKWFATAGDDQTIFVWDASDYSKKYSLIGHTQTVAGLAWSDDGKALCSVSADGTLKVWDIEHPFGVAYEICDFGPWQVPVTPDGRFFAAPCSDKKMIVYDIRSGLPHIDLGPVSGLCGDLSADGKYLATSSFDGIVRLWDLENRKEIKAFEGHSARVDGVAYLNLTNQVLSVGDTTLRIWSPGAPPRVVALPAKPFRIVLHPDETKVYISFSDKTVRTYSTENWQELATWSLNTDLQEMKISPDGNTLAAFCGKNIELWNTRSGKRKQILSGHEKSGYGVGFSPDGHYLISGSYDQTFKLWDLSKGRCTLTFHGFGDTVYSAQFINDRGILIGSAQGRVRWFGW